MSEKRRLKKWQLLEKIAKIKRDERFMERAHMNQQDTYLQQGIQSLEQALEKEASMIQEIETSSRQDPASSVHLTLKRYGAYAQYSRLVDQEKERLRREKRHVERRIQEHEPHLKEAIHTHYTLGKKVDIQKKRITKDQEDKNDRDAHDLYRGAPHQKKDRED